MPQNPPQIFLAHANEDKEMVRELYNKLVEAGYNPWWEEDIMAGLKRKDAMIKALGNSDFFLACLSSTSIKQQGYFQAQFKMAMQRLAEFPPQTIYLIPLKLDDCDIPELRASDYGLNLRELQWLDYWKPNGFDKLVESIEYQRGNQADEQSNDIGSATSRKSKSPSKSIPSNLNKQGSSHFIGRDDKLKELHELLQQENKAAICAVSGMGGIGKTELAVQYALQYQEEYTGGICWLQVRGADIGTQIVNYGRAYLGLTPPDDQELMVQLGYCWSNWGQENTLIVFDDIDDYKAINDYLPPSQPQFKVVMTSRVKPGSNIRPLNLNVLSENDSLQLLRSILGEDDKRIDEDLEGAKALCEWLGYLPLGLELVARHLKEHSSLSIKKLQRRLEKKKLEAAPLLKEGQSDMTGQLGVASAFELTWEDLDTEIKSLGCFLSLFAPVSFEWSWVQQCYVNTDESTIEAWNDLRDDNDKYQNYLEDISEQLKQDGQTVDGFEENLEEWLEQSEEQIEQLETERDSHLIKRHLLEKVGETEYKLHPLIRQFFQVKSEKMDGMDDARRKFCAVMLEKAKISQSTRLNGGISMYPY